MPGTIPELDPLTTPADGDLIEIVDVSDTTMSPEGTNKKFSWANIYAALKSAFDSLYATAAQGSLADSAVQPGDLGTAAYADTGDFATTAQGALADTALQPDLVKSSGFTAANNGRYVVTASLTVTDPSPEEGKGYVVVVRNGTATIGGVGYSTAGTQIRRLFHSGGWATYADSLTTHTHPNATTSDPGFMAAADKTKLDGIEAGADVTDATNVGSAISGAATETTLADTDEFAFVTSLGALKNIAYSALKTLLNALYAIKGAITGSGLTMATGKLLGRRTAGTGAIEEIDLPLRLEVPFSDQTSSLTTGTKITFTWRFGATTLTSTPVDVAEAPTGSAMQFNVTKNGSTIYSTKPTIDAGETSTSTAATPAVLSTTTIADGDIITIAIDQIGSTNSGKGGILTFIGTVAP